MNGTQTLQKQCVYFSELQVGPSLSHSNSSWNPYLLHWLMYIDSWNNYLILFHHIYYIITLQIEHCTSPLAYCKLRGEHRYEVTIQFSWLHVQMSIPTPLSQTTYNYPLVPLLLSHRALEDILYIYLVSLFWSTWRQSTLRETGMHLTAQA